MGLSLVSAGGAAVQLAVHKVAAGAARGGRNAEVQCVCVLLCFVDPILGNRYGPGVSSFRH